jgi:hypothetical protein
VAATNGGGHLADAFVLLDEVRRGWPALRVDPPEPLAFTLGNGSDQLAVSFADVERLVRPPAARAGAGPRRRPLRPRPDVRG